jgi:glucose/arabinose dehydrogenase
MTILLPAPGRLVRHALAVLILLALAATGVIGTGGVTSAAPVAGTSAGADVTAGAGVGLTPVVSGLASPTQVVAPGDGSGRLFVVQQGGRIRVIKGGVLLGTPFINLSDKVVSDGERGLLGLAFHPDYESNGRFYVYFTRKSDGAVAINEYRVSGADADVADPSTRRRIMTIKEPYTNHNGGRIGFGPDGYFYAGTGDGGSAGDPGNRARNKDSLLGKMLRIDVDRVTSKHTYGIPSSNPYVGRPGRNEVWSIGLRNPWGWSFDRVSGDLWIGDVGQSRIEEINRASNTGKSTSRGRGVDFGWRVMEGRKCYHPSSGCNKSGKREPITQYKHSKGCSVTGGYAYRGSAVPALAGRYVFGDWCTGTIWTISRTAAKPANKSILLDTSLHITSFGEDESGELYVLDGGGTLYRMDAA